MLWKSEFIKVNNNIEITKTKYILYPQHFGFQKKIAKKNICIHIPFYGNLKCNLQVRKFIYCKDRKICQEFNSFNVHCKCLFVFHRYSIDFLRSTFILTIKHYYPEFSSFSRYCEMIHK